MNQDRYDDVSTSLSEISEVRLPYNSEDKKISTIKTITDFVSDLEIYDYKKNVLHKELMDTYLFNRALKIYINKKCGCFVVYHVVHHCINENISQHSEPLKYAYKWKKFRLDCAPVSNERERMFNFEVGFENISNKDFCIYQHIKALIMKKNKPFEEIEKIYHTYWREDVPFNQQHFAEFHRRHHINQGLRRSNNNNNNQRRRNNNRKNRRNKRRKR